MKADTSVGSTLTDAVLMNGYVFNADVNAASANARQKHRISRR